MGCSLIVSSIPINPAMREAVLYEGQPLYKKQGKFVLSPDGTVDFGWITEVVETASQGKFPVAPIRLEHGTFGFGHAHIRSDRIDKIKEAGYTDELHMLQDVAQNFTKVYEQPNGRLLLVKKNGRKKYAIIQLQMADESYYGVNTWLLEDKKPRARVPYEKRKGKLLLHVARATDSGQSIPFITSSNKDRAESDWRSGQSSSKKNIAEEVKSVNSDDGPAFRKWFGDWEVLSHPDIEVTELTGNEISGINPKEARKNATEYLKRLIDNLGTNIISNERTGFDIQLNPKQAKHGFQHKGKEQVYSVPAIVDLIRRADKIATNEHRPFNPDIPYVHTFVAPLRIDGQLFAVKLTVKEYTDKGKKFYDHEALKVEELAGISGTASHNETLGSRPAASSNVSIADLLSAFKGDNLRYVPSKVVDENGEPLVVSS